MQHLTSMVHHIQQWTQSLGTMDTKLSAISVKLDTVDANPKRTRRNCGKHIKLLMRYKLLISGRRYYNGDNMSNYIHKSDQRFNSPSYASALKILLEVAQKSWWEPMGRTIPASRGSRRLPHNSVVSDVVSDVNNDIDTVTRETAKRDSRSHYSTETVW